MSVMLATIVASIICRVVFEIFPNANPMKGAFSRRRPR